MPARAHDPRVLAGRNEREPADRALSAHLVGVQQVDRDRLPLLDRADDLGKDRLIRVAQRALPQADVAPGM